MTCYITPPPKKRDMLYEILIEAESEVDVS